MRLVALLVVAVACSGGDGPRPRRPELVASSPRLPPLEPIDPDTRGAAYLTALASQIQPRWGQFLEDCRLRLPADHPLNTPTLVAAVELVIAPCARPPCRRGLEHRFITTSGNRDFDTAVVEVLREITPPPAPPELESDDGLLHLRWTFARDRRQAGPASAQVMVIELPLATTVTRLLDRGELDRAARRLAAAPLDAPERLDAAQLVMIAALREGLASSDGYTREAALEAVERTRLAALARDVHRLVGEAGAYRVQAIRAAAALRDPAVLPALLDGLAGELDDRPEIALAKIQALAALGAHAEAARVIHAALATPSKTRAVATAVAALAIVPDPALAPGLAKWFARGDAEVRQSVCAALPAAAPARAGAIVARGLRDPDATVRGTCADAAARHGKRAAVPRLVELVRDRDEAVRARAIAALGVLDPRSRPRSALRDRAPRVRAAAAVGASEADLRILAVDRDPDVRAAAIAALGERAPELALAAARDPAAQVRRAAVEGIIDDALLDRLGADADPDTATAALSRLAARRGRAAITRQLLERLVAATPKSRERVRIARAWLLAR